MSFETLFEKYKTFVDNDDITPDEMMRDIKDYAQNNNVLFTDIVNKLYEQILSR